MPRRFTQAVRAAEALGAVVAGLTLGSAGHFGPDGWQGHANGPD